MKTPLFVFFFMPGLLGMGQNNTQFVNVFIGTDGTGHTFPGPSMPFGMVQPGPDNREQGWSHTSGYQYQDTLLMGFSQTRFSGTGISEMGDVLLLPFVESRNIGLRHRYFKSSEKACVGYYTVTKKDQVKVELTCSQRVAFHRYTFPSQQADVLVDLQHGLRFLTDSLVLESSVKIENKETISGFCHTKNWVDRKYFFVIRFDRPFERSEQLAKTPKDNAPKYVLSFILDNTKRLQVKISLSTVDVEGAKRNLQNEITGWDFEKVKQNAVKVWNEYLGRIDIEAGSRQKEIFYTALYHLFLQPSNIADVNGEYRGADDRIAQAPNNEYYSTLSIWDIYRGAFPLLEIIAPEKINGIVNSLLLHHKAAGFLPIWTAWGQDNYCMIGNHAIPMILSAYNKGFTGFDQTIALKAMVETSTKSHINSEWELYNKFCYYPFDKLKNESVSRTLESGYDDWCVAEMASKLGDKITAEIFYKRANYYNNLYDAGTKMFRGKDSKGNWRTPFDPLQATSPMNNPGDYTEANAWQYFWTPAQFDIEGMKRLLGGNDAFTKQLNNFFTLETQKPDKFLGQEAMIGQYAHGNEPGHHIVYLYAYSNTPCVGQKYIHQIISGFHNNTPNGMIGNDDCGQMSAWYILSSLGFYPVNPAGNEFVLGAAQLKKASIHLAKGQTFTITAPDISSQNIYSEKIVLNGKLIDKPFITYQQIMNGGILSFEMTDYVKTGSEKYQRLPFGSIKPLGWLKVQMQKDMAGFVGNLDRLVPDLINDPIYSTERLHGKSKAKDLGNLKSGDAQGDDQYKWWNSETQSNWWDGYIRNALLLGDQPAIEKVKSYIHRILATQDEDGYLGIYDKELRYKFTGENGELWSKTTLYRGLLAYYEYTHDENVMNALVRAVDNVMQNYPVNQSQPFFAGKDFSGGVAHGLTFTDVLDRMHQLTGDPKYADYAAFLYRNFSENYSSEKDAQLPNISTPNYKLQSHGVHTYEHLRPLIVAAYTRGTPELRNALKIYLERIAACTTPTGGAIGDEWIAGRWADATNTGYEYCSLHELMDSYTLLFQKSGDIRAAEEIETIFYNAAQGSRNPDHSCIAYLKTDNSFEMMGTRNGQAEPDRNQTRYKYSPAHQDVAVCCVPNAGRISPGFLQGCWLKESENTLLAAVLGPNILETTIENVPVIIEEITEYPYQNKFIFRIKTGKAVSFKLKIRKPEWAKSIQTKEKYQLKEGYLVFDRKFSENDQIELEFQAVVQVKEDLNHEKYFSYGALIYAKPIQSVEHGGKVYAPGFIDLTYSPTDSTRYEVIRNHQARFQNGKILINLKNKTTQKTESTELIPLGKTILRQASFK